MSLILCLAMLDERGQVFATGLPGRLSDVFGIRVSGFDESEFMNDVSRAGLRGRQLRLSYKDRDLNCQSPRFDVIEATGAEVVGRITSLDRDYEEGFDLAPYEPEFVEAR